MNHIARGTHKIASYLSGAWVTVSIAAVALLLMLLPTAATALQWNAIDTLADAWRVLTCHLTHWSTNHFFWDALALVVLGSLCEAENRAAMTATVLGSAVLIPLATLFFCPEIQTYRGLSGIDSGLFTLAACQFAHAGFRKRDWFLKAAGCGALIVFALKIAFEVVTGGTVFVSDTSFVSLPIAHVVGAIVGVAVFGYGLFTSSPDSGCFVARNPRFS